MLQVRLEKTLAIARQDNHIACLAIGIFISGVELEIHQSVVSYIRNQIGIASSGIFQEVFCTSFDIFAVVSIGDERIVFSSGLKGYSLQNNITIRLFRFYELPFLTAFKISAHAITTTPIKVAIGILPIANPFGYWHNALILIIAEGYQNVYGFRLLRPYRGCNQAKE